MLTKKIPNKTYFHFGFLDIFLINSGYVLSEEIGNYWTAGPILDSEGMGAFLGEHFSKKSHFSC